MDALSFLKKCGEIAQDLTPKHESLEWEDPSLEATKHIPNQHVDEESLPSWSHAGDHLEIIIGDKNIQTDSLDTMMSDMLKPKF